jgi:two-component system KDP operon response regulator KdpE
MMEQSVTTKKLLIVDDEEDITSFLRDFFKVRGFSVFTASSSIEAQSIVQSERPPCVLLDLNLRSRHEGLELLKWMNAEGISAKVIMATADDDPIGIDRAMSLGASEHIRKPYSLEALQDHLKKFEI